MISLTVNATSKQYRDLKRLKELLQLSRPVTQLEYAEYQRLNLRVRSFALKKLLDAPIQRSEVAYG